MNINRLRELAGTDANKSSGVRMVEITKTYLIDVKAASAKEAEQEAEYMLRHDEIDLKDPTSYSVIDRGIGSWDD